VHVRQGPDVRGLLVRPDIQRLPPHHTRGARGQSDLLNDGQAPLRRQADFFRPGQEREGFRQERVAREDRRRLAEHFVAGGFAAAEVVVVHRRQVVVDQGIRVDQLQRAGDRHHRRQVPAAGFRRGQAKNRTDPFAPGENAVVHGGVQFPGLIVLAWKITFERFFHNLAPVL